MWNRKTKQNKKQPSVNIKLVSGKVHGTEKRVYEDRSTLNFIVLISPEKHASFIDVKAGLLFGIQYCI